MEVHPHLALLEEVIDPELGINIVDLGLVYAIRERGDEIAIDLTMTSPACPMAESLLEDIESELEAKLPCQKSFSINLVWEPAWSPARMSDRAKEELGWEP